MAKNKTAKGATAYSEVFEKLNARSKELNEKKANLIEHCNGRIRELEERRAAVVDGTSIAAGNDEFVRASKELRDLDEDIAFFHSRIKQLERTSLRDEEVNAEVSKVRAAQVAIVEEGIEKIIAILKEVDSIYEPIFEQVRVGDAAIADYKHAAGKYVSIPSYYSDPKLIFLQNTVGRFLLQLRNSPYYND